MFLCHDRVGNGGENLCHDIIFMSRLGFVHDRGPSTTEVFCLDKYFSVATNLYRSQKKKKKKEKKKDKRKKILGNLGR